MAQDNDQPLMRFPVYIKLQASTTVTIMNSAHPERIDPSAHAQGILGEVREAVQDVLERNGMRSLVDAASWDLGPISDFRGGEPPF